MKVIRIRDEESVDEREDETGSERSDESGESSGTRFGSDEEDDGSNGRGDAQRSWFLAYIG